MTDPGYGTRTLGVAQRRQLGAYTLLAVHDDAPAPLPGQFAMLAAADGWGGGQDERPFLPRAVSVCAHEEGRVEYLLEAVGPGTELLCGLQAGAQLRALGPLGNGFSAPREGEHAVLVGGGIGVAPLVLLERRLSAATVLLGFRDAPRAAAAELFTAPRVATDDGSVGAHGSVLVLLEPELAAQGAKVYACGPAAMLEAVRALCDERSVACELALESPMACGYGACWGCVVPLSDGSVCAAVRRRSGHRRGAAGSRRRGVRSGVVSVEFCGLRLAHPVINGSGTFDALAAARALGPGVAGISLSPHMFRRRSRWSREQVIRRRGCGRQPRE